MTFAEQAPAYTFGSDFDRDTVDAINRTVRPLTVLLLVAVGFLFLLGLGLVLLYRYAVFGELDWGGLIAFGTFLFGTVIKWFHDRHVEKFAGQPA